MIELLFTLLIGISEPTETQMMMYHTLTIQAPETLEYPQRELFHSATPELEEFSYNRAIERFELSGNWACEDMVYTNDFRAVSFK